MLRYVLLDLMVFLLVCSAVLISKRSLSTLITKQVMLGAIVLLVFTIVFDNIMIKLHFFDYNHEYISRIFLGLAPIEDLAYPVVSLITVVWLWGLIDD
jgi:lycopene cyclase domain-containing protein